MRNAPRPKNQTGPVQQRNWDSIGSEQSDSGFRAADLRPPFLCETRSEAKSGNSDGTTAGSSASTNHPDASGGSRSWWNRVPQVYVHRGVAAF